MKNGVPHSLATDLSYEAEEHVLGALLLDPAVWLRASQLCIADFSGLEHKVIFQAMEELAKRHEPCSLDAVASHLMQSGRIDSVGGRDYLELLKQETPTAETIEHYARYLLKQAHERPLRAIGIQEFLALEIPPRRMLLAPVLPEQGLMMIFGPRGLGKTHLTVGIAVAVASGSRFLRWSAEHPAPVLLVDGEMPAGSLQERLAKAVTASERPITAALRIITPDLNRYAPSLNLSTSESQGTLDELIGDAKLIILDNLSCLMTGAENDAESWQPLQTWALKQRAAGRSVAPPSARTSSTP
jgi:replicative DNA helicase